jgi:hypothetical protein
MVLPNMSLEAGAKRPSVVVFSSVQSAVELRFTSLTATRAEERR